MSLSQKIADKVKAETDELRQVLINSGLFVNKRTELDMEDVFTQLYISIPSVMTRWHNGDPTLIMVVHEGDNDGTLFHTEVVPLDPKDDPLLFAMQDYEQRVVSALNADAPDDTITSLPRAVMMMGFLGECVRGAIVGSAKATRYLSAFMRFMFPDQNRFYVQLGITTTANPPTVTIAGYFTDA